MNLCEYQRNSKQQKKFQLFQIETYGRDQSQNRTIDQIIIQFIDNQICVYQILLRIKQIKILLFLNLECKVVGIIDQAPQTDFNKILKSTGKGRSPQIQLIDSLDLNNLIQQKQYQKPRLPVKQEIRSNSHQKYDNTSRVNIQPLMIIWLKFTLKLEELEKQHRVQVVYEPKSLSLKGGHFNVDQAKQEIESLVNIEYTMDYLYQSETFKYEDLVPYDEILINEDYMRLIKLHSNLCLMNKKKLIQLIDHLQHQKKYTGCDGLFQMMPESFVLIFCRKVEKEEITKKIYQIIGIIKNRLDIVSQIYTVQKMDLIWIHLYLNIKELSRHEKVHLNFTDHKKNDSLVLFSVTSSNQENNTNMIKFILYSNISLWVMVKFLIQNSDESLVKELKTYNHQNFPNHEIFIYHEDQVFQAAQSIDQIYSTSVTLYLSRIDLDKQNGQIKYLKKVKQSFLFLLTEKTIKDDLLKNVKDFLESKQVQHSSSIVNKTQNKSQVQQLSSISNKTQNMTNDSSLNDIIRSLKQGFSISQLSVNQSNYTESLIYSEISQGSIIQNDSQFQQ